MTARIYKHILIFVLAAVIFLLPFYFIRFTIIGIPTNILEITVLLFFLLSVFFRPRGKKIFGYFSTYLFLAAILITCFFFHSNQALGIIKSWVIIPILFFLALINLFSKKDLKNIFIFFWVPVLLVSLWGVMQKTGLIGLLSYQRQDMASFSPYIQSGRMFGPFESPNFLAMFLVPLLLILISTFSRRILILVPQIAIWALGVYVVFLTSSKGGEIALLVSLAIIIFCYISRRATNKKIKIALYSFFLLLILLAGIFFSKKIASSSSNEDRLEIYRYSIQLISNHPIVGIGPGNFQSEVAEISKNDVNFQNYGLPYALHAHNLFLNVWLSFGVLGLLSFLLLLIEVFLRLWRRHDQDYSLPLFGAILAILIHGLFDTTYFKNDLSIIFWMIMAFSFILSQKEGDELGRNKKEDRTAG